MRISKTLLIAITAFVFTSCQKEYIDEHPVAPPTSSKVKTYSEDLVSGGNHSSGTFNLSYDSDNKLISMTSAASSGDRFEYHYSGDTYTMDLFNSNTLSIHEEFYLNSLQLIDSTFQYNDTGDSSTEKYLYNASKQIISLKQYEYSGSGAELWNTERFTYDNRGNVIKVIDDYTETTYDYYSDLVNNLVFGPPLLPRSKDLVKTTTFFDGDTITLHHVYTFDAANRISTEKITSDDGDVATKTYTYY
jgi:hypothetical protein